MKKVGFIIKHDYSHVRTHVHNIDFSGVNLDMFKDVPDDIELQPIVVDDILNDC